MRWKFWIPGNFVICFLLYSMVTSVFANAGDEDLLEMDLANLMDQIMSRLPLPAASPRLSQMFLPLFMLSTGKNYSTPAQQPLPKPSGWSRDCKWPG